MRKHPIKLGLKALPFTDTQGRTIRYLRLSLTGACQMRCTYCRPACLSDYERGGDLTADELADLVRYLVDQHGLTKVRLTGGDPTARPDLIRIIEKIAQIEGIEDLAMTTNGLSLASRAQDYVNAGLHRVNISLDSLDRDTFKQMTGVDGLKRVLTGIRSAVEAGLTPIKLNTVVMRGDNEDELPDLVRYAASVGAEIRFIELMPMGPLADRWADHYVSEPQMQARIAPVIADSTPITQHHDSARRFHVTTIDGDTTTVGFITPMSCNFCDACNRLRITADGSLYPCLMDKPAGSLMPGLRPSLDQARLDTLIGDALHRKQPEHPVQGFVTMTHIGG